MRKTKCHFKRNSVTYLGHVIDSEGIHATPDKVKAIVEAPMPTNVQQLRSFLGLLNYYRKFLPNLASIIQPLNDLLCKNKQWEWTDECVKAANTAKQLLTTSKLLTHYDPELPLRLAADASQYGLGAVISHILPSGLRVRHCSVTPAGQGNCCTMLMFIELVNVITVTKPAQSSSRLNMPLGNSNILNL